jgi:RNA polymerase sigma-54 factor
LTDPVEEYPDRDNEEDFERQDDAFEEEFSVEEYIQEDDFKDYGGNYGGDDDEQQKEIPIAIQDSFFEKLQNQLDLQALSDNQYLIGNQIIGSLDDDGYLRRPILSLIDDLAFSQNVMADEQEVEEVLGIIQEFDPPGIGARDLQECLLIQLKKKDQSNPIVIQAEEVVKNHLDEFTKKHYDKIERQLGVNSDTLRDIVNEILKLNPKPGDSGATSGKQLHIIPDFHITNNDGALHLTLNGRNAPELRVSRSYQDMFQHYEKAEKKR